MGWANRGGCHITSLAEAENEGLFQVVIERLRFAPSPGAGKHWSQSDPDPHDPTKRIPHLHASVSASCREIILRCVVRAEDLECGAVYFDIIDRQESRLTVLLCYCRSQSGGTSRFGG